MAVTLVNTAALDMLVVFGYGPVETYGGRARLNVYARLGALAAGTLLRSGQARQLLITGGRTGGEAVPAEAELIKRYLQRVFQVTSDRIVLEPHAQDTLENLVFAANLLDARAESQKPRRLGFLALEMHLPRIRWLAELIGLAGHFVALEGVVAARSARHTQFLNDLSRSASYRRLKASQDRAMRGLNEMPDYWLPLLAKLECEGRLERIRGRDDVQHFLSSRGLSATSPEAFRRALEALPRRFPEPSSVDGSPSG